MLEHDEFLRGCNAPDTEFKDQINHHCYVARECHKIDMAKINPVSLAYFSDIEDCMEDSYFDCPALEKFNEYVEKSPEYNLSFNIGVSTHYFTDAHVPVHQTMGEDWWECHLPFEKQINENLEGKNKFWIVKQSCLIYFPCERHGKVNRKCEEGYTVDVIFSYEDIVRLIEKTDTTITDKLNFSYKSDYSYLLKKEPTGFFSLIIEKILKFFNMLPSWFKR